MYKCKVCDNYEAKKVYTCECCGECFCEKCVKEMQEEFMEVSGTYYEPESDMQMMIPEKDDEYSNVCLNCMVEIDKLHPWFGPRRILRT